MKYIAITSIIMRGLVNKMTSSMETITPNIRDRAIECYKRVRFREVNKGRF